MIFEIEGPFEIKRFGRNSIITKDSIKELMKQLNKQRDGLADACGCYVFCRGFVPHYVGQACRSPLLKESMNGTNIIKYNEVLGTRNGKPRIFYIPMMTPKGKFCKKPKRKLAALDF